MYERSEVVNVEVAPGRASPAGGGLVRYVFRPLPLPSTPVSPETDYPLYHLRLSRIRHSTTHPTKLLHQHRLNILKPNT